MSELLTVALIPRDGFFCKDGRDWFTSASGRGHGLEWPWPSTILGSLRTAWGRAEEAIRDHAFDASHWKDTTASISLGQTVVLRRNLSSGSARNTWRATDRAWQAPRDALWFAGRETVVRLDPVRSTVDTLGRDNDVARENLWFPIPSDSEKPQSAPAWWSESNMAAWLAGNAVRTDEARLALERRLQAHVGIDASTLAADASILFSHDVVETLEPQAEWAIGADVLLPNELRPAHARLGSDGRIVTLEPASREIFDPPEEVLEAFRASSPGLRLVVTTPAAFSAGWLFDGFASNGREYRGRLRGIDGELILRSAFVPRPMAVSGWDMAARAPKPTTLTVVPGSVYFFERVDGKVFSEDDARLLWLSVHGARADEGFGRVVPGVWKPRKI